MPQFTDMDMLQDYEKDTRLAAIGFITMASEVQNPKIRKALMAAADAAMVSQSTFAHLITKRGDRP